MSRETGQFEEKASVVVTCKTSLCSQLLLLLLCGYLPLDRLLTTLSS